MAKVTRLYRPGEKPQEEQRPRCIHEQRVIELEKENKSLLTELMDARIEVRAVRQYLAMDNGQFLQTNKDREAALQDAVAGRA